VKSLKRRTSLVHLILPLKLLPFKDPEVLFFEEEEDSAIGLATTLVEHREKAPISYFFFMISRQLKQSDSQRDFGLGGNSRGNRLLDGIPFF
jgi:hypothetical protein